MNIFSIDLTHPEINFIRQALETVSIQGRDAKFCATLQIKLEQELEEITSMLKEEEENKMLGLQEIIESPKPKTRAKKL
jgi:predicted nucleotidyltransferase